MRLTLRTMLAYIDDVLEPADAQDIARKIEESEFATLLMNRIRDSMRRLRLGAPRLRGRGTGVDPNTVAEYLDNTLSPERVPELEKICLESDMHLAEVAACHQILTLVLGEQAEVDEGSRQRMYQLIAERPAGASPDSAATHSAAGSRAARHGADAHGVMTSTLPARQRPEVPDYLRESSSGWRTVWQLAAAVVLLALVIGSVWMAIRPEHPTQVAGIQKLQGDAAPGDAGGSNESTPAAGSTAKDDSLAEEADAGAAPGGETSPPVTPEDTAETGQEPVTPAAPGETPPSESPAPVVPAHEENTLRTPRPVEPSTDREAPTPTPRETSDEDEEGMTDPFAGAPLPSESSTDESPIRGNVPMPVPATPSADPAAPRRPSGPVDVADQLASPKEAVGRYVSTGQVLLGWQAGTGTWERLRPQQVVFPGEVLLSLPTFRSTVSLKDGLTLQMVGPTRIDLEGIDLSGSQGIVVSFGRLVIMSVGNARKTLRVKTESLSGLLTFSDAESTIALEVRAIPRIGADPAIEPGEPVVEMYVVSGQVQWQAEATPSSEELAAPSHRTYTSRGPTAAPGQVEFPEWIHSERLRPIDEKASAGIEAALNGERPVVLRLKELAVDGKAEIRALAARTLCYLDEFAPLFDSTLNDPHQQAFWNDQVDCLVEVLASNPASAAKVRDTLAQARAREASNLYRMLWGYTDDQLNHGDAAKLVDLLDHKDLDVRVISFWNLRQITGRTLSYRPDDPSAKRQPHISRWRQRLDEGLIRWNAG